MRKSMQLKAVAFAAAAALMGVSGMASASEAAQTAPSTFKPGTYTAQVNGHNAWTFSVVRRPRRCRSARKAGGSGNSSRFHE